MFMKTERLTDSISNSGSATLSNYNIKTLMLWACELKPRGWWTHDLNVVRICVELLHTMAVWLTDARCQHYFINDCNLFDQFEKSHIAQVTANRLMSITRAWFCQWCIYDYVHKCAKLCPSSVLSLLADFSTKMPSGALHRVDCLQHALSAVVKWRQDMLRQLTAFNFWLAVNSFMRALSCEPLNLRLCIRYMRLGLVLQPKSNQVVHFVTASVLLLGAYKTAQGSLTDEMLDVLATMCLQSNYTRRCLNARHSSVLSLSQAAMLMKVVANNLRSTVQLIKIELSKAYLHRALRCEDSDSNSVYCLTNVYLSVLYYTTDQYQLAIDHCALVTRNLKDHSLCSSHVVQGELLPRIDDQVDIVIGLAVFYQYVRAAALNEEQERRHVSVFSTELFAHYLHIKFLSVFKCHQLLLTSLTDKIHLYRNCFCNSAEIFVTDAMLFRLARLTKYLPNDHLLMADGVETKSLIYGQLDTSKLVEHLLQYAVEHWEACRELEARDFDSTVSTDFHALYAYKCGKYQQCLQLSISNVRSLIVNKYQFFQYMTPFPQLIQLMDDEIVSFIGLTAVLNGSHNSFFRRSSPAIIIHQLSLSLYLITQCQIKLRHSVTSLTTTLHYVRLVRFNDQTLRLAFDGYILIGLQRLWWKYKCRPIWLDQHVLKFAEQKLLRYISVSHQR